MAMFNADIIINEINKLRLNIDFETVGYNIGFNDGLEEVINIIKKYGETNYN